MKLEIIKGNKEIILLYKRGRFENKVVSHDLRAILRSVCIALEEEIPKEIQVNP